jgi:hypothetical protein
MRDPQGIVGMPLRIGARHRPQEIESCGASGFAMFGPYEKLWYNEDRWL